MAGFNSSSSTVQYHALLTILSTILLMLKDRPTEVPKQHQNHFARGRHTFEFLGPGCWCVFPLHAFMFARRFMAVHSYFITWDNVPQESLSFFTISLKNCMHISMHAPLFLSVSCFGTHLAQILWYPRSLWMMEYVNPQLISNLSAISVTVIHLPSWIRALTCSTLYAICQVVRHSPSSLHQWHYFCYTGTFPLTGTSFFV